MEPPKIIWLIANEKLEGPQDFLYFSGCEKAARHELKTMAKKKEGDDVSKLKLYMITEASPPSTLNTKNSI